MSKHPAGAVAGKVGRWWEAPRADPLRRLRSPLSPGPRGSGGGGVMAELTALESLIEMGFPKGRA